MGFDQRLHIGPIVKATARDKSFTLDDFYDLGFCEDLEKWLVTPSEGWELERDGWSFISATDDQTSVTFPYEAEFFCKELTVEYIASMLEAFKEKRGEGLAMLEQHFTDVVITYGVITDWV